MNLVERASFIGFYIFYKPDACISPLISRTLMVAFEKSKL